MKDNFGSLQWALCDALCIKVSFVQTSLQSLRRLRKFSEPYVIFIRSLR